MISHNKDSYGSTRIMESHKGFERSSMVQFSWLMCLRSLEPENVDFQDCKSPPSFSSRFFPALMPFKGPSQESPIRGRINHRKANKKTHLLLPFLKILSGKYGRNTIFQAPFFFFEANSFRGWKCVIQSVSQNLIKHGEFLVVFHPFVQSVFLFWQPITLFFAIHWSYTC